MPSVVVAVVASEQPEDRAFSFPLSKWIEVRQPLCAEVIPFAQLIIPAIVDVLSYGALIRSGPVRRLRFND